MKSRLLASSLNDIFAFSSSLSNPKRTKLKSVDIVMMNASIASTINTGQASLYTLFIIMM